MFLKRRSERELDEEIRGHVERLKEEHQRRGLGAEEAHYAALRDFGGIAQTKEAYREQRGFHFLDTLGQDLRYAFRTLRRSPGFAAIAILSLALGIGVNTVVFSALLAFVYPALPYRDANRILRIQSLHPRQPRGGPLSAAEFIELRRQGASFANMAAAKEDSFLLSGQTSLPERLIGARVTPNLFRFLGAPPEMGRDFREEESYAGRERVAVLGYGFWERHYGRAANVLGRSLKLNGEPYTIIGVVPPWFHWLARPNAECGDPMEESGHCVDVYVPAVLDSAAWGKREYTVVARLKPGATLAGARAEMKLLAARLASEQPRTNRDWTFRADVLNRTFNSIQPGMIMIQIAALFVLLIACANTATLLLARSAARQREMAVRSALGAGRGRILRQLLTEGILLAAVAGVLALAVADWTARFVSSLSDSGLLDMTTDWRVTAFTTAATLGTAIGFALLPALRMSKIGTERSPSGGGHSARLRSVLVAGEAGLSMVLFVAAGLMLRSWLALIALNPGFNPHHLLAARVPLNEKRYRSDEQRARFVRQAIEKIRTIPGVTSVASVNWPPLWGGERASLQREGTASSPTGPMIRYRAVTAGYFQLLGVRMLRGRDFRDGDANGRAAIVDAAMAHSVWPDEDPIGKRVRVWRNGVEGPWLEIVGVAPAMANSFVRNLTQPQIFELSVSPSAEPWLMIRTAGNPESFATAVRDAVFAVDRDQPLAAMQSMDDMLRFQAGEWKLSAQLFGGLAALAMLLSLIGTYGILAYSLAQRGREIGIRMALGARPRDVVSLIARQGLGLALAGVATGVVLSLALMRFLANAVYGVTIKDPKTYAAGIGFLLLMAVLSVIVPARRAARIDPAITLRHE